MDDIIAAIGSWLTETHEAKRRMVSNLETLFWIAFGIASVIAAKDHAAKRKALMTRTEQALPEKDLKVNKSVPFSLGATQRAKRVPAPMQ